MQDRTNRMRIYSVRSTTAAGSGHPTGSCSAADLMGALLFFDATTRWLARGLRVRKLAVREVPRPGKGEEPLEGYGVSARHIGEAVHEVTGGAG